MGFNSGGNPPAPDGWSKDAKGQWSQSASAGAGGGGGGGKGGGPPSAPDFTAAANAQTAANRPNQTNAFGSTSQWSQGPNGQWNQTSGFGGPLGGAARGLEQQFADANKGPLDNGAQARQHAEDAIYGRETSRLDPQWQQREQQFGSTLANQGIDPNSEAYAKAMGNFGRDRNDAYQQANYGAIMGGGQEGQRQQQMDLQSRMAPLQGLEGMSGLTGQSGFAQSQLLPAAIAQYQGALQGYGIQQQGKNSTMGGLSNLGGAAAMGAMMA